ncbi:MAG: lipopolysaccharide heptosyltransferase II [Endomicrobia bacterium]|nr:lipopolysaccharide heptosyltransferase II [Endomicrobiia bacterium]
MKILIIKPSGIGDIVHSLPVAIGLKRIYSRCQLHWLVFSKFKDILQNFKYVDKVLLWDRNAGITEYIKLIKELRKEKYDTIIDLQVLMRTALLGFLVNFRRVVSTGFVREFTDLFVLPVAKFNPDLHAVERNYQVVEFFAKQENKTLQYPVELLPWIFIDDKEQNVAKNFLSYDKNIRYIIFSVGSRGWHKIWPWENFVKLIKLLNLRYNNMLPVLVGSKEEVFISERIAANLNIPYINLTGKTTLRELCAVINLASMTISNDNGIAHISAAMDKPTIILFGPSNPIWFYPYNKKSGFIYKNLKCSPCGIRTSCKNNRCMKEIYPEEVFDYITSNFDYYIK